ncbi:rhamnulokinase [Paenibacillus harenae]|uniref:Rhamnulokinase n=1 Tax=Paenibacillus harenae TaxID=306543 RepID=A0ABT9TXU1_PAEHA|nr:rhamnulokinase family protein [Paenibacillus harenae]MDQ0111882.1 rhamnulokinase [Paenibacillus harenae]
MNKLASVLAFDLGASSGRALIGELVSGNGDELPKLKVTEIHRFPNDAIAVGSHLHWDILRLLQELKIAIRRAFQEGYEPQTFGIDTWGVDFGLLDSNGELLGNPYHYRDPQTEGVIEELAAAIGKESLYEQGGLQFMPFNTINQLYAMKKSGSPKLEAAQTLLLTPDLLTYFLTGAKVCEFTMATTTQLLSPLTQAWNVELMERLGIPSKLFLDPIKPGTRIAPLTAAVCTELDVPPIEAVAVATHDTESAIAAIPAKGDEPFAYIVSGTWSLLGSELHDPIVTPEAMSLDFSNEGGACDTYQLIKNIMGLWIIQECKREWEEQSSNLGFAELVELARQELPFRSLIQPDNRLFYAPGGMIGRIQDYCSKTNQPVPQTKGQIMRCVIESLSLRYRQVLGQLESLVGHTFSGLYMVGGGIQNELLCQFTADAIGRPVWTGPVEASAIGNMLLQLVSLGHCTDLKEARSVVATSFPGGVYLPSEEPAEIAQLEAAYERFNQLHF